jgi:hypothetical protein
MITYTYTSKHIISLPLCRKYYFIKSEWFVNNFKQTLLHTYCTYHYCELSRENSISEMLNISHMHCELYCHNKWQLIISLYFGLNLAEGCSSSSLGLADSECRSSSVITVTNSLTAFPRSPENTIKNILRQSTFRDEDGPFVPRQLIWTNTKNKYACYLGSEIPSVYIIPPD